MRTFIYISIILGLTSHGIAQAEPEPTAKPVSTLFQVEFTTNDVGGCNYIGETTMQNILNDALDLIGIGIQLVTDYGQGVMEARRLLDSFFDTGKSPLGSDQLQAINTAYTRVGTWIENGGPVNNGASTTIPYLFCYHNWLQKNTMESAAKDNNGNTMTDPSNGEEIQIKQIPMYVDRQKLGSAAIKPSTAVPYWSLKHNNYMFDKPYARGLSAGYCTSRTSFGATINQFDPSTITLCPLSFGSGSNEFSEANFETAHYVPRRTVPANPVPSASIPKNSKPNTLQKLPDVTPTALTLLHEIFHLVLGTPATVADVQEVYSVLNQNGFQIVGLSYTYAIKNPESFAMAAIAYDYTLADGVDKNNNRVEFYTGYVTQG